MCRGEADGYLQLFGRVVYYKETDSYMVIHTNNTIKCNVEAQRHCKIWPLDIVLKDFKIVSVVYCPFFLLVLYSIRYISWRWVFLDH